MSISGSSTQFRIASYNVKNLFDKVDDPGKDDEGTPAKSRSSMNALGRVIDSCEADVVALQEVENIDILTSFRNDQGLAEEYPHLVLVEGNDRRGIDVALMSKHPISGVTSHKDVRFDVSGESEQGHFLRDLLQADIEVPNAGPVRMFVSHFCSQIGGDRADRLRKAEAETAQDIVRQETASFPSQHYVVVGDFNDKPGTPAVDAFLEADDDGWKMEDGFRNSPDSVSYPTDKRTAKKWGYKRIDHILVSPELAEHQTDQEVHKHQASKAASDHWLISATFSLPTNSVAG